MADAPNSHRGTDLTDRERQVLDALCRPLMEDPGARPATNQEIADEVFLSVDAVKGHLRLIYAKLGLESLPQNEKRARLAALGVGGKVPGLLRRRRRRHLLRRRAVVSPALAAGALALLAALALAVLPGGDDGRSAGPAGDAADASEAPALRPDGGATPAAPRSGGRAEGGTPILFDESSGLLPITLASTEVDLPGATTVVEGGDSPRPLRRSAGGREAKREASPETVEEAEPESTEETADTEAAPAPRARTPKRRRARRRSARRRRADAPAPAPQQQRKRCVIRRRRVVEPKVVWRRKVVKVRHRTPHEHVRVERRTWLHPHERVWFDKKGRRHEETWMHEHERVKRHRHIHWHVRTDREVRRVRTVVRHVKVVRSRQCT